MKKLLTIVLSFFICAAVSAQNTHTTSNSQTNEQFQGGVEAKVGLINGWYRDTTSANLTWIKNKPGAQIVAGDILYIRNSTATKWVYPSGGASTVSIYNDSSLVICNSSGCDTFKTNIVINNFTIVNDSMIVVCPTAGSCDTLIVNPQPFAKPYVDSVKIKTDSLFYYIQGLPYFGGLTGGTSSISITNDSTLTICSPNGCDTFRVQNITINNFSILNDSTIKVCDTSGVCDTIHTNPTSFSKSYVDSVKVMSDSVFYYIQGVKYYGGLVGNTFPTNGNGTYYLGGDGLLHPLPQTNSGGAIVIGGIVSYSGTGMIYNVTPVWATNAYFTDSAGASQVTLSTADPTYDRVDAIVITKQGVDSVITGVASANPELPQIDPTNEILLAYIIVKAGEVSPAISIITIYDQDTTGEWSPTASGLTANFASTVHPYHLDKATLINSWTNGNKVTYTAPSPVSTNSFSTLTFYVYLKSSLSNPANISIQFYSGASAVGNTITLAGGYGFSKTTTGSYQPIAIPFSALGLTGNVDRMVFNFTKSNPDSTFIDWIQFQSASGSGGGSSGGSANYVTSVYRKNGTDSVFQVINGVPVFAYKDSIGNGGGTTGNADSLGGIESNYFITSITNLRDSLQNAYDTAFGSPDSSNVTLKKPNGNTSVIVFDLQGSSGNGTVTSFSKTDGYGISSTVTNPTTTPNYNVRVDTNVVASKGFLINYAPLVAFMDTSSALRAAIDSKLDTSYKDTTGWGKGLGVVSIRSTRDSVYLVAKVYTLTSSATITINTDTANSCHVTALAVGTTFANPTGSPNSDDLLTVRIKDNGSSQTLAWGSMWRGSTDIPLPSATTLGKTMYLEFIYNSTDTKWDLIRKVDGF